MKAHEIKHALREKHTHNDDFFATEVKNGPTHLAKKGELAIIDGLAIKKSWVKPCITGYEVKVSRSDFLNDDKWPAYKNMCHRLYFVCPTGLIQPDELPDEIGLIWYNPEKKSLYTRKKSMFRDIEMPYEMLYYIIMSKLENTKHPFFDNKTEYFQEYLEDKINAKRLGFAVGSKLIEQVAELEDKNAELKRRVNKLESKAEELQSIKDILKKHGIRPYSFSVIEDLDEALSSSVPRHLIRDLEDIQAKSERILKTVSPQEDVVKT
ncbi:MmcB family DNA repair protein [Bacillaceae bacterium W0354]